MPDRAWEEWGFCSQPSRSKRSTMLVSHVLFFITWDSCSQMAGRAGFILNDLQKLRGLAHWLVLGMTVVLFAVVLKLVDLKPHVDENFFFSSSDPKFQESKKIEERFPAGDQLIVSVSSS